MKAPNFKSQAPNNKVYWTISLEFEFWYLEFETLNKNIDIKDKN
jgi:hypothetical protein